MEIYIATNNGDMGGGEVMLMSIARAIRSLGHQIRVIVPRQPDELAEAARDEGFSVLVLPATDRKAYMAQLQMWRSRNRQGLLWCNGLVPALATAGDKNRIVHLHQLPTGLQKTAVKFARRGARATLVPSTFMAEKLPGTRTLENWVPGITATAETTPIRAKEMHTVSVGFLGRVSEIKGTDLLAEAIAQLNKTQKDYRFKLVIGGEARFINSGAQDRVERALQKLEGDLVTLGWVEPNNFFAQVDCVAMPSQWEEPFGLVAAEAMSAKKPLLVTRSGALPAIVGEDYPWIAERESLESLAQSLLTLANDLSNPGIRLEQVVANNYWRWYEEYSPEAGKERVRCLLEELES